METKPPTLGCADILILGMLTKPLSGRYFFGEHDSSFVRDDITYRRLSRIEVVQQKAFMCTKWT